MAMSVSALRQDIYRLLDQVIVTGEPLVVERRGHRLAIAPAPDADPAPAGGRLARLRPHPGAITGDLDDLDSVTWVDAWRP
jgi:hypothetical protein